MAKCANCANEAFYTYAITAAFGIDYCSRHVPKFLQAQKNAGMLALRVETPVVPEPIVEPEIVVEEPVVEPAPTPKKKTTSKKKTV